MPGLLPRSIRASLAAATAAAVSVAPLAPAQAEDWLHPDAKWQLRVDVAEAAGSPLGQALLDRVRFDQPRFDEFRAGVADALGLDPLADVGVAVVCGDYENLDEGGGTAAMAMVAELLAGPGNLEGWALGMPGYESHDLDERTLLHSFLLGDDDDARRVWAAVPSGPEGRARLVAATDREAAAAMARRVVEQGMAFAKPAAGKPIATLRLRDLADAIDAQARQPGSAVMRSLTAATASLRSGDELKLDLELRAFSEARARQVFQMLNGLRALTEVVAAENPQAAPLVELADRVELRHDGAVVTATLTGEHDEVLHLLEMLD